ncbi:MAG: hypothetical protein HY066_07550 [Betaproteobacteria bacterium]|nr:hypothetical protein [Betaproteobacteria bacterium]
MRLTEILLAWLGYFALHSLLAATTIKAWVERHWPRLMPGYRMVFNLIATLALAPVVWLVYSAEGAWLWQWQGNWAWVANGARLAAILCFLASTRYYDMSEFLGLSQLRAHDNVVPLSYTISPFHRFVRHPWYSIALVLIWTGNMNGPLLVTGLAITAYLFVGSKLEERKLIASYGESYRKYMAAVPGLIPLPWKYLSADDAKALSQ